MYIYVYIHIFIFTHTYQIWCVFVCMFWLPLLNGLTFFCEWGWTIDPVVLEVVSWTLKVLWWLMGNLQMCDILKCSHVISWCVFKCSTLSSVWYFFRTYSGTHSPDSAWGSSCTLASFLHSVWCKYVSSSKTSGALTATGKAGKRDTLATRLGTLMFLMSCKKKGKIDTDRLYSYVWLICLVGYPKPSTFLWYPDSISAFAHAVEVGVTLSSFMSVVRAARSITSGKCGDQWMNCESYSHFCRVYSLCTCSHHISK